MESGAITLTLEGNRVPLKNGEIFFIPPDKTHAYAAERPGESSVFVVCFETFAYAVKTLGEIIFPRNDSLKDCVNKIIDEYKNTFFMNEEDHLEVLAEPNFGGQQAIILQLEYLIICLLRKLSAEKNPEVVF